MEIKVLFYCAKRRKTVWKGSMGLLYKFGKRQLLSFGLPEMPMVWLALVTGESVMDSQGVPGQEVPLWGHRIGLCFKISSPGEKFTSTDVILTAAMWRLEVPVEIQSVCEVLRASSELQGEFS